MKTSDKSIIERLEALSKYIELMLDKPIMFAQTPEALEMSIMAVFQAWQIIIDSPLSVRDLWREEVVFCFPDSDRGYSTVSLANKKADNGQPGPIGNQLWDRFGLKEPFPGETTQEHYARITYHMRRVWNQLKYTGGTND